MSNNKKSVPKIFIDKNGNWFQDGIKITHKWTYLANNKNLDIDSQGKFFIDEGNGRFYVEVEDTPFVVKMINKKVDEFQIQLNDESTEKLNFENFYINEQNIPYVKVKNNKFNARFTSAAYYELIKYATSDNDEIYIIDSGKKYYLSDKKSIK
ncbi:MAG: DUF1285 domain-containing protein [Candidatus Dadabacteria bacterium]|nr:DUF1285 domain-containing protein [Candidatus Dadabacteria bacterium]NIQ13276.1 DUF1285 domain-containing protein [Candidatus Dadabacteria bacterium]